jgi:hypothetical protein
MSKIVLKKYKVKQLWNFCEDGLFAVPEIQREFVWDPKRSCKLLDSLYLQLPIGSMLVWETASDRRHLLRHAQEILPPHRNNGNRIWFLIDGQQRLSVIYRAKAGHPVKNWNGNILDFSKLCFSFDERYVARFLFMKRPLPKLHIPIVDILSENWQRRLKSLPKNKLIKIKRCRDSILNYEVPVIFVKTNELEEVRETFLRINSGGLRISEANRAFTRASRLNLRRLMVELRNSLPCGFSEIDYGVLQSAMALIVGQKEISSSAVESAITKLENEGIAAGKVSRRFAKDWHRIDQCIRKAVDYLVSELGVINYTFLPSDNMIAVLSYFFFANNGAQPKGSQRREIRKWFWSTGVGRRYAGRGYYQNIRSDISFFENLGRRRSGKFVFRDLVPVGELKRTDYLVSGSLTTAFFLLLIHRQPRYLETGNTIPLDKTAAMANRKDKHHIFPKALLNRNGFSSREGNSLCNICYIVAEENQSIGSNKPAVYLDEYRKRKHFAGVMKSHLIPYKSDSGLWGYDVRKGYRQFSKQRLEWICREFEKTAGIKLFRMD